MKIHTYTIFIIFCGISLVGCTQEYDEHYRSEHSPRESSGYLIAPDALLDDPQILTLPDKKVRDSLIESMDLAHNRIWIEIYTWTDKVVLDAVIRAFARGVDVRVILEPNVFGTPTINKSIYEALKQKGIPVSYADGERYVFTHAKFIIIDDRFYISTGNLTQSFFTKNRDFILSDTSREVLSFLIDIFERDFSHLGTEDIFPIPSNLVFSPVNSREKIGSFLGEAKSRVIIYTQTLQDEEILSILTNLIKQKREVQICTAKNESNTQSVKYGDFSWKKITKPYLHAKVIFIDENSLFIGSQNLTQNSLDNNREIGIIIRSNTGIYQKLMRIYEDDCIR